MSQLLDHTQTLDTVTEGGAKCREDNSSEDHSNAINICPHLNRKGDKLIMNIRL